MLIDDIEGDGLLRARFVAAPGALDEPDFVREDALKIAVARARR